VDRHRIRFRWALGLVLVLGVSIVSALGWGPAGRPADAQGMKGATGQPTRLQVIHFSVPPVLVAAKERGFFAAQGLQVENIRTQSSAQLMHGLIDGTYDIACTNADNWIAYGLRENADVFLFQGATRGDNRVLVVRPEIESIEDLRGQALAVDAVDSGLVMILWQMLADHGVDFRTGDPRLVPVGATQPRLDSMARGETAAGLVSARELDIAQALGLRPLAYSADHLPQYPAPECGTSRQWAARHEPELIRFIRAYVAATRWALDPANREETMRLYMQEAGVSREAAEEDYGYIQPEAVINVEGIRTVLGLRLALGFLQPPGPPAERFYDTRYWETAMGRPHPR
jgi:ABC-type nitrate/sulfonate/bicarbonate transport system substrate-binding protein